MLATRLVEKDWNVYSSGHFPMSVSGAGRNPQIHALPTPTSCSGGPDTVSPPHCVGGRSLPGCWPQGSRHQSAPPRSSSPGPGCQTWDGQRENTRRGEQQQSLWCPVSPTLQMCSFGFLPLHPECFVSRRKRGGRYAGIH